MTAHFTVPDVADCRSCGAAVSGKYCSNCAEPVHPHPPSLGEFVHEFVGHYLALEGKLVRTLGSLLRRPGELTAEFMRGRRVPFVEPLRLYLTMSLVFFALMKLCGIALPQLSLEDNRTVRVLYEKRVPQASAPKGYATLSGSSTLTFISESEDDESDIKAAMSWLTRLNPDWESNLAHFSALPSEEKTRRLNQGIRTNLPYMLILALPLFALYMKLAYAGSGQRYAAHLVFALHVNAFAFLLASLMATMPGSPLWLAVAGYRGYFSFISVWDAVQLLPLLAMLAYLPLAMQRVYGGHVAATILRWLFVLFAHIAVITAAILVAELFAILAHG